MIGDMYGDFSRLTFAPEKHFSAVLLQQGRVMLDADINELTEILLVTQRLLIVDLIGPYAGPTGNAAFAIAYDDEKPRRLRIGLGRYYVQGLACELDAATTYDDLTEDVLPNAPFFVYLKVWERQITTIQDPSITEPALGENRPDTAVRSKVVWQVFASAEFPPGSSGSISDWEVIDAETALTEWEAWERASATAPRPLLKARAQAGYSGLENQLYRVEVHAGGSAQSAPASFKWSRDNGSAVFPIASRSGCDVTLASLGSDPRFGLMVDDWVEMLDNRSVLRGERHPLLRVRRIVPTERLVVLEGTPPADVASRADLHPFLRRWDQREQPASNSQPAFLAGEGVLLLAEGTSEADGWLELESGVQIQFQPGGEYTAGDYWLIPARVAGQDIEWPRNGLEPAALPPTGIAYAYAPLAIVDAAGKPHDLRSTFAPISNPGARARSNGGS